MCSSADTRATVRSDTFLPVMLFECVAELQGVLTPIFAARSRANVIDQIVEHMLQLDDPSIYEHEIVPSNSWIACHAGIISILKFHDGHLSDIR